MHFHQILRIKLTLMFKDLACPGAEQYKSNCSTAIVNFLSTWHFQEVLSSNDFFASLWKNVELFTQISKLRDLNVDGCQSNLYVMLKQLLFFIDYTTSFVGGIL